MPDPALHLLHEVSWQGRPVAGARAGELLAVLVAARGRAVSDEVLAQRVWDGAAAPAHPTKALQVLVSRLRSATIGELVTRAGAGYLLGIPDDQVDSRVLDDLVSNARAAQARGDALAAVDGARAALAVQVADPGADDGAALTDLRERALDRRAQARGILGRALSVTGDHAAALGELELVADPDEATVAALLRSTAAVHGAPAALERYERHRARLADDLGVDPGPLLQAVHAELLAADRPIREGLRYDASSLVGRGDDVRALRALLRESRVTSIIGPGGLGKTRLAHVVGREAEQSVVHFVELVGVTDGADVIGEIGSVLGVRDSLSGRRVLTVEQRTDVRARIATQLAGAPTLLILDNCEHVVEAVADLVAYLVATEPRLRVLTTTRAPLAIAAERLFPLGQLGADDAVELFAQRARAARPDVPLPPAVVRRVVERLDGLPLAIELAAAKVRVMSVADIDRRLDDRFSLLRGGSRSAPDRHRTLLAVIDWSWALLGDAERRGLRRLSPFHDGFGLAAAESVLGAQEALEVVLSLVDQSLLTVVESSAGVRYRMLETVREFGRLRLGEAGEEEAARGAVQAWARDFASETSAHLYSPRQVEMMDAIGVEENNLGDALRAALADADTSTVMVVLAALGAFWTIRGEHARMIVLQAALEEALVDWEPAPDRINDAVAAAAAMAVNTSVANLPRSVECHRLMGDFGPLATEPYLQGLVAVLGAVDAESYPLADPRATSTGTRLEEMFEDPNRAVAALALQWASHARENDGDPDAALALGERALSLWREDDGPWTRALGHTQLAGLYAQIGRLDEAQVHAEAALPLLGRLGADDDAIGLRTILACAAIEDGRLDDAERLVALAVELQGGTTGLGGGLVVGMATAELTLARGQVADGLAAYRSAVEQLRSFSFPGFVSLEGLEPWIIFGEAAAMVAHARHGHGTDGLDLYEVLRRKAPRLVAGDGLRVDVPVAGTVLFAVGTWGLVRGDLDPEDACALLVLADRCGYSRFVPTLAWRHGVAAAESRAPGLLARAQDDLGTISGPALLAEARARLARLT